MRRTSEGGDIEPDEVGHKQEEAPAVCGEAAWREGELADVGDGLDGGPRLLHSFLVKTPGQGGEAFLLEHLAHRGGAETQSLVPEDLADLVDGVVLFAQGEDAVVGGRLLGLVLRPRV